MSDSRKLAESLLEGLRNAIEYAKGDKSKGKETVIYVPVEPLPETEKPTSVK